MSKIIIRPLKNVPDGDESFVSDDKEKVIIGTADKSISVLENGKILEILSKFNAEIQDSNNGYIEVPTNYSNEYPLLVQWGRVDAVNGATETFSYHKPFNLFALNVQGTMALTSNDDTIIKVDKNDNNTFRVRAVGGTANPRVFWFALGI